MPVGGLIDAHILLEGQSRTEAGKYKAFVLGGVLGSNADVYLVRKDLKKTFFGFLNRREGLSL